MTIEVAMGIFTGVIVLFVNEGYRRNMKKEINKVKKMIIKTRVDLKKEIYEVEGAITLARLESKWLTEDVMKVYKKDKEIMEVLKREVPRINEEE